MANIGWSGFVMIIVVALIVFGPKKLPEIGKAFGETLREFKKSTSELTNDESSNSSSTNSEEKAN